MNAAAAPAANAREAFARALREARAEKKLTVRSLARLAGVRIGEIVDYESAVDEPNLTKRYAIARALELRPGWFIETMDHHLTR